MKSLYVTSVERYSGKTAACLALGARMKSDGYKVGYLKPLSLQPWRVGSHVADEDAAFVKEILELPAQPWELAPVVVTQELLRERLKQAKPDDLMPRIMQAYQALISELDVLILEGGGSLREGYVVGLPTPVVAKELGSPVLAIIKFRDEVRLIDDIMAAQTRLGKQLGGIMINRVPAEAAEFVSQYAAPFIERQGISIYGVLPEQQNLAAFTVGELIDLLQPELLTKLVRKDAFIENLTVGAMTAESALSRFRKYPNKAVITGGDRADILMAALETSTSCLILTGNLRPSALIVKQAEEFGVPVLLVRTNTMETVERIERTYGKTRLGNTAKLRAFQELMDKHFHYNKIYSTLGL